MPNNRSEESHRRTDGHILFTLVVGYFACAQYDALFIPYRHFVPLPPKEEAKPHVILNDSEESHRTTERAYTFSPWSWDISLTLNMTYYLSPIGTLCHFPRRRKQLLSLRGKRSDEAIPREGGFLQSIFFSLWSWDISLALNMTCYCFLLRGKCRQRRR